MASTTAGMSAAAGWVDAARARRRRARAGGTAAAGLWLAGVAGAAALPRPDGVGAGAAAAVAGAVVLVWARRGPDPDRWLRGAAAERETARLLGALPPRRYRAFHDLRVPGSRANIDHVVVGRTGVWVIDTKSSLAPARARWRAVHVGDRRLDPGPLRWEAGVVADRLGCRVRPLVVVHAPSPGLRPRGVRLGHGVRAVPAAAVAARIRRGRRRATRADVDRLASVLVSSFRPPGPPRP